MNSFYPEASQPIITDELLSAYLDNEVTPEERALIEHAASVDSDVAWRLNSLQQTVQLVRALPRVAVPRAFVLRESDIATAATRTAWWQALFSPTFLRGAAMITAVLCLTLLVGDFALFRSGAIVTPPPQNVAETANTTGDLPPMALKAPAAEATLLPEANSSLTEGLPTQEDARVMTQTVAPLAETAPVAGELYAATVATNEPVGTENSPPSWLTAAQLASALLSLALFVAWRARLHRTS